MGAKLSRQSELAECESLIIDNLEGFVIVGNALKRIRDQELYRESEYKTWSDYLRLRVGEEFGIEQAHSYNCITGSEIRPKLPQFSLHNCVDSDERLEGHWPLHVVLQFASMAPIVKTPTGQARDFRKLRKADVSPLAKELIRNANAGGARLTAKDVKDRVKVWCDAHGMKTKKRKTPSKPALDLNQYLIHISETVEDAIERLGPVSGEMWEALEESDSGLAVRTATGCAALASFLRSS